MISEMKPSFFEMTVAMAFDHFARHTVQVAVIETGLGGRLDSTNIITPNLSIITNISLDHTEFLGNDLTSIAREKGGIIKPGVPLVIGRSEPPWEGVLFQMAREKKALLSQANKRYKPLFHTLGPDGTMILRLNDSHLNTTVTIRCDLSGLYQHENLITALASFDQLKQAGWNLPEAAIMEGLASVVKNTGIMGRWQTVGHNPRSICDTAHNQDGIAAVMEQIKQVPWKKLHVVWGMVGDKDLEAILPLLPAEAQYYFTPSSVPRSLDANKLHHQATLYGLKGSVYHSVEEAYKAAQNEADPDDMIFTGGSTFVVADLLKSTGSL